MKFFWTLLMLFSLVFTGCSGDSKPVNLDKDKPKPKTTKQEPSS